jgi:chromosome segregation ATPase
LSALTASIRFTVSYGVMLMHDPTLLVRSVCVAVLVVVAGCQSGDPGNAVFNADDLAPSSPVSTESAPVLENDGSLASLTAEVRQLRVAVEQLARSQTEAQALAAALSARQSRVEQITRELDEVRREIERAASRSEEFNDQAARLSQQLSLATDLRERAALENALRQVEAERDADARRLQNDRGRESNLSRTLALEEDRWNDLLARAGQSGR